MSEVLGRNRWPAVPEVQDLDTCDAVVGLTQNGNFCRLRC
jgi:hypothetical protein